MRVIAIHGIHSKEGDNNMHRFADVLRHVAPAHWNVEVFSYGFMGFWQARWRNNGVAKDLAAHSLLDKRSDEMEAWITHSNGAAVAYLATTREGARPDIIININPALDRWRVAPVWAVETIHSSGDRWVNLSRFLPGHIWGDQGKVGVKAFGMRQPEGPAISHAAHHFGKPMAYTGHCDAFDSSRRGHWARFVAARLEGYESAWKENRNAVVSGS